MFMFGVGLFWLGVAVGRVWEVFARKHDNPTEP